jgi:nitrogen fixation/metabolism regulation signal transduction histidine kinase
MSAPKLDGRLRAAGPGFERRLWTDIAILLIPATLLLSGLLLRREDPSPGQLLAIGVAALATLLLAARLCRRVIYPLYTLSNLLEALREGDYSLRGSRARRGDAIGDVVWEVNALSHTLREQRLRVEETSALLAKVIAAIDIALFSFDDADRLQLINPAGERLLGRSTDDALGRSADELGLSPALAGQPGLLQVRAFPGGSGRYEVRHFGFRQGGRPQRLIAINDLSHALREEERLAWQRLIRVLGHELNNSLAPVKSMAETLTGLVSAEPLPSDWREDVGAGLKVIADRAAALNRFMQAYSTLARLPPPNRRWVQLGPLLRRVVALEQRQPVRLEGVEDVQAAVDPDQLEQALINLVRNAVEASAETRAAVVLRCSADAHWIVIEVLDEGPGLASGENLFVPFFTTKPHGSGIGLALARQIAESHGGELSIGNRSDRAGAIACLRLPAQVAVAGREHA